MGDDARDELLGRLLGVPLDRFVEQRNRIARELRDAGDRETASWLAALRRPAPGIWALDQLARGDRDRMRALLDLGAELRSVQSRAIRGDREAAVEMRELGGRVQRGVDDVVRRAAALLRDAGHGAGTDTALSMAATLRGVLAGDEEAHRRLEAGLLLGPVEEGDVFGFDATAPPALRVIEGGAARAPAAAEEATAAEPTTAEREAEDRRVRELRRRAAEAAAAAEAAEREASRQRGEVESLRAGATEVRARIRALEDELHELEEAARTAELAARDAVTQARAARRDAEAAEAELPPE